MKKTIRKIEKKVVAIPTLKRVAAYARVSSEKEEMLHPLAAQVSHYSTHIQRHPGWTYAGVYVDEALTGTKDNRVEFIRLVEDCRTGKIDLVLTKSISRFARNTVDLLETVRELKALGIDVFFEKENIHSMSNDGELMLTILAGYAQEESRSASENCKWRIRRQFENGELANLRFMFGYKISKDKIGINPEQAAIVRMIFEDYIGGMGGDLIAQKLRDMNIPKILGGEWRSERVIEIIKNEKYTGNALLQKKFVVDHLTKKLIWNKGQLPKYFAEGTHPAIIDQETFDKAQAILKKRTKRCNVKSSTLNRYPFSGILECGNCGKKYKRKLRKGRKPAWQCSIYLREGKSACHAKQVPEATLYDMSIEVLELDEFDENYFKEKITKIIAHDSNRLTFILRDGGSVEKIWQRKSRRESWTDDMKRAASYKAKEGR